MYIIQIVLLMLVLPIGFVLIGKFLFGNSTGIMLLIGKWFVFWAVGIRQLVAGLRQSIRPQFTAESIFQIKTKEPLAIVQELGFANVSMGILGISSMLNSTWTVPSAIVSGLFYGIAGIRHLARSKRNSYETIAMLSDLFIFAVLVAFFITTLHNE